MFSYAIFPCAARQLLRHKKAFVTLLLLAFVVVTCLNALWPDIYSGWLNKQGWMQRNPAVRSLDFLAGMVAYEVYLSCKDIRVKPFLKHLLELALLLAYLLAFSRVLPPWTHRALVILTLILFAIPVKGFLARGLETKPFLFIGKISFSLYIIHEVVLKVFIEIVPLSLAPYLFALFMYAVTVGLSYLSCRYVEPWGRDCFLRLVPVSLRKNQ